MQLAICLPHLALLTQQSKSHEKYRRSLESQKFRGIIKQNFEFKFNVNIKSYFFSLSETVNKIIKPMK